MIKKALIAWIATGFVFNITKQNMYSNLDITKL